MKNSIKLLLTFILLAFPMVIFAQGEIEAPDTSASGVLSAIMPFAVYGATWAARKIAGVIPSWATMLVVAGLSAAGGWILTQQGLTDLPWIANFGLGLAAVFVNEFRKAMTSK